MVLCFASALTAIASDVQNRMIDVGGCGKRADGCEFLARKFGGLIDGRELGLKWRERRESVDGVRWRPECFEGSPHADGRLGFEEVLCGAVWWRENLLQLRQLAVAVLCCAFLLQLFGFRSLGLGAAVVWSEQCLRLQSAVVACDWGWHQFTPWN